MAYLKLRFREGSTWAGLFSLIPHIMGMVGTGFTPAGVAGLVVGVVAVIVPESANGR